MKLKIEHRSNGLAYVEVFDGDKLAGSFSLSSADVVSMTPKKGGGLLFSAVEVSGEPVIAAPAAG